MKIGILPNIDKPDILNIVKKIVGEIRRHEIGLAVGRDFMKFKDEFGDTLASAEFLSNEEISRNCDMVLSIGGDGTMLHTAYEVRGSSTPILGLNIGKLGFLAEFDMKSFSEFLKDVKSKNYIVEERMALVASCCESKEENLFAINDMVIDKGPWSKMIELTIKVDDDYVSTFSADGIIVATPTGSTGYSLSAGGPIVSPKSDVITLSPIAPHTLTMRPLVLSSKQKISIIVNSPIDKIQISCDGQRVNYYTPPVTVNIRKSETSVKLVHSNNSSYFEILRDKLYWGLDVRKNSNSR